MELAVRVRAVDHDLASYELDSVRRPVVERASGSSGVSHHGQLSTWNWLASSGRAALCSRSSAAFASAQVPGVTSFPTHSPIVNGAIPRARSSPSWPGVEAVPWRR